jgi:hypothetical protein
MKSCYYLELDSKVSTKKIISKSKSISEFIVDETLFKVGSELIWFWVSIEPKQRPIIPD